MTFVPIWSVESYIECNKESNANLFAFWARSAVKFDMENTNNSIETVSLVIY